MFRIGDATDVRRSVGGGCLVVAPLLFAAAELIGPESAGSTPSDQLAAHSAHYAATLTAVGLTLLMSMTLLVGTFTLVSLLRDRGAALANVSGAMVVYGLVTAHAALPGVNLVMAEMARPGNDRQSMVTLMDGILHDPMGLPLLLGHFVFTLGIVLLGVALYRARLGPRWAAVCIGLAPLADIVLGVLHIELLDVLVSDGLLVAGFSALGMHVLSLRDEPRLLGETVTGSAAAGVS